MNLNSFAPLFRKPIARDLAKRDLEEAKRKHLEVQAAAEYYSAQASYYDGLIRRLTNYLADAE